MFYEHISLVLYHCDKPVSKFMVQKVSTFCVFAGL